MIPPQVLRDPDYSVVQERVVKPRGYAARAEYSRSDVPSMRLGVWQCFIRQSGQNNLLTSATCQPFRRTAPRACASQVTE